MPPRFLIERRDQQALAWRADAEHAPLDAHAEHAQLDEIASVHGRGGRERPDVWIHGRRERGLRGRVRGRTPEQVERAIPGAAHILERDGCAVVEAVGARPARHARGEPGLCDLDSSCRLESYTVGVDNDLPARAAAAAARLRIASDAIGRAATAATAARRAAVATVARGVTACRVEDRSARAAAAARVIGGAARAGRAVAAVDVRSVGTGGAATAREDTIRARPGAAAGAGCGGACARGAAARAAAAAALARVTT